MVANKSVVFGSGPLGLNVARILARQGTHVLIVNRSGQASANIAPNISVQKGDATSPDIVHRLCKDADSVFHCAMPAYTQWPSEFPPITRGIMEGLRDTSATLVYGDNLYSYGDPNGTTITENMKPSLVGHKGMVRDQMAKDLLSAHEQGWLKVAIGRASDFYGPEVLNAGLGDAFFGNVVRNKPAYLLGNVDLPHTHTFIRDFAQALVKISQDDRAFGKVWHVPSADTITTRELVHKVESILGHPVRVRAASRLLVSVLGLFNPLMRETKELMCTWEKPYIVDHSQYAETFGKEVTPHDKALEETLDWYSRLYIGANEKKSRRHLS